MGERQIKKHIHGKPQIVRVDAGPGWRGMIEDELKAVLSSPLQTYKFVPELKEAEDGIEIQNIDFRQMLELPLRLLSASEILWQLGTRHVGSFGEFEEFIRSIDWQLYFPEEARIKVRSQSFRSTLYHEGKLDRIARGILAEAGMQDKDFRYLVKIEQRENRCTAYLSLTTEPIFRRRYKVDYSHPAPLQEHLAAAAVRWAQCGEEADMIYVPFAGSGTLLMESWLYYHRPGLDLWRPFQVLEDLPEFPASSFGFIRGKLQSTQSQAIMGRAVEIDSHGQDVLEANLNFAAESWPAIRSSWEIGRGDFLKETPPSDKSKIFLPLNPPYGLRLEEDTQDLYRATGRWIRTAFEPHQRRFGFILVAESKAFHAFEQAIGSDAIKGIQSFTQGGQHIRCVKFDIEAK